MVCTRVHFALKGIFQAKMSPMSKNSEEKGLEEIIIEVVVVTLKRKLSIGSKVPCNRQFSILYRNLLLSTCVLMLLVFVEKDTFQKFWRSLYLSEHFSQDIPRFGLSGSHPIGEHSLQTCLP